MKIPVNPNSKKVPPPGDYSDSLMDQLATILLQLSADNRRPWKEKALNIQQEMIKRGADTALEEFVSWSELLTDEEVSNLELPASMS